MVTKYGFSEKLGPVNYSSSDEVFLGKDFSTRKNYSEEIASEIDEEIKHMIEGAFVEAEKILNDNLEKLHAVAKALLEVETLDGEQLEILCTGEKSAEELIADIRQKEEEIKEANEKEAAESERLRKEEDTDDEDDSDELEEPDKPDELEEPDDGNDQDEPDDK
jgi:cell division protease FtsH